MLGAWLLLTVSGILVISNSSRGKVEKFADLGRVYGDSATKPIVILEPAAWVNKDFPLLQYIEGSPVTCSASESSLCQRLREGKWTVVLYSSSCIECQKFLSQLNRKAVQEGCDRIAILELPPYGVLDESLGLGSSVCRGRLRNSLEYFAETPLVFETDMGVVRQVRHGCADASFFN